MVAGVVAEVSPSMRSHLRRHLPPLFEIAFLATGGYADALLQLRFVVNEAVARSVSGPDESAVRRELVSILVRGLEERLGGRTERSFEDLDTLLRSDITRPIELGADPLGNDPRRIEIMLWHLKRTCMVAMLGALPISLRLAVILTDLSGFDPPDAAALLGINERAYRVRLTRARKRLESYAAPRCQHVDPDNPCTCVGRLAIAMDAGFVAYPADAETLPKTPHDTAPPKRAMAALLATLPLPRLRDEDVTSLLSAV